jgi:hypothetical protein
MLESAARAPSLVTMHLWRVPGRAFPQAVARMAADRGRLRRTAGLRFAKLLGTGKGRTFTPADADPLQWGLLACWSTADHADAFERSPTATGWGRLAAEQWRADLRPLSSRGRWSGTEPFGRPVATAPWTGRVAAVTRARLTARRAARFWRAVPAVSADLAGRTGLLLALGIGEAPIGLQGTFSVWRTAADLRAFAYAGEPHAAAVRRTPVEGWYGEELFARFAVLRSAGTLRGRQV